MKARASRPRLTAGADLIRRVKELCGPGLAPGAGPCRSQAVVSGVCRIISDAKRNEIFMQALGKEGDDVAVLGRSGLAWVRRSTPPLRSKVLIL